MGMANPYAGRGGDFWSGLYDVVSGEKRMFPSSVRTYLQALGGRQEPITGNDFSDDESAVIQYLARHADPRNGAVTYNDTYERFWWDEEAPMGEDTSVFGPVLERFIERNNPWEIGGTDPASSVQFTLGQFKAEPTVDGYRIQDTYDFDPMFTDDRPLGDIAKDLWMVARGKDLGQGMSMINLLEGIAARFGPSEVFAEGEMADLAREEGFNPGNGRGIPVDFTIPYDPESETDQMNRKRIIQQLLSGM